MGKLNCCGAIVNQVYLEGKAPKPLEAPKGATIRRPKALLPNKLFKDFFPTENEPWYDGRKHLLHLGTDRCAKHCEKRYPGWMDTKEVKAAVLEQTGHLSSVCDAMSILLNTVSDQPSFNSDELERLTSGLSSLFTILDDGIGKVFTMVDKEL